MHHHPGTTMAKTAKPSEPPRTADDKPKKPPLPLRADDDDYEDGDMATPKRDRYGPDDEPL